MTPGNNPNIRLDYSIILQLVAAQSRVLDLGCGDGELLYHLIHKKQCQGTGIEIDEKAVYSCIERGVTVLHSDIISGLKDFSDKRFDYVILNESLQQVLNPQTAILAALRVGKNVIVGIPNFCHITARFQIFFRGRVPVTRELPYEWYNTPNLRFFSLKDFRSFCRNNGITIIKERDLGRLKEEPFLPNLFAYSGIFLLRQ
ncbi:MAG TPA: methionine biosynthesis protein MetW [Candidatus Omnitrophota bacterium]|nr:methionine biosynthesis protein MetW [Candidatus Omnitrophota bacterium]HQP12416.1 methionine biosynthesis protein MetW [Candidatus Omnitrophota bacterium]